MDYFYLKNTFFNLKSIFLKKKGDEMAVVNFVLQGKGGIGKSLASSLLSQYLLDRRQLVACFDTDPVNTTFAAYDELQATIVEIMDGDVINSRLFDTLIEKLIELPDNAYAVIDSGASTFFPLAAYLAENDIAQFFSDTGHKLVLHTLIAGGQAETDTIQGLNSLLNAFPGTPITIWVNPFFGQILEFSDTHELAKKNEKNGGVIIFLPSYKKETFGHDIETILKSRLTFDQAINSERINIMAKQRLKIVCKDMWSLFDEAGLINEIQNTGTDS